MQTDRMPRKMTPSFVCAGRETPKDSVAEAAIYAMSVRRRHRMTRRTTFILNRQKNGVLFKPAEERELILCKGSAPSQREWFVAQDLCTTAK